MDMLRYHRFTVGAAWADEYGSADEADQFANVYGYSPVHGVRVGVDYPPVLVLTADHDDRVHPAHSFKYAATLQAFAMHPPSQKPRLIRIETAGGHGAGKPVAMRISEAADVLAFIGQFTGLKSQP
jgi:prolyl oligopeptidase